SLHQLSCDTAEQYARQMHLQFAGRLHVIMRFEIERVDRGIDLTIGEGFFSRWCANRSAADSEKCKPHIREFFAVGTRGRGKPNDRVVAMTARQFGKARARRGRGGRNADRGDNLLRTESRFEQPFEEVFGFYRAP